MFGRDGAVKSAWPRVRRLPGKPLPTHHHGYAYGDCLEPYRVAPATQMRFTMIAMMAAAGHAR